MVDYGIAIVSSCRESGHVSSLPGSAGALGDIVGSDRGRSRRRLAGGGPRRKLTSSQIEGLGRDKIVVTEQDYLLQAFSPYVSPDMPVFITSDSILNAYHVLLEESVLQLEQANAQRLPEILQFLWKNLESADKQVRGKPGLAAGAKRRARIVLGTAIELLGGAMVRPDADTARLIREEVGRVEAASGQFKPAWLGPKDDPTLLAIDYSRYKPRGFYSQSDELSRHFRAAGWLQAIPFRVDNDEELLAILMLGNCMTDERFGGDRMKQKQYRSFFECFREFLGDRDDWDLSVAATAAPGKLKMDLGTEDLKKVRKSLLAKATGVKGEATVNDQIAYDIGGPAFRILSAYRIPDAVLFQRTTDINVFRRPFPSGLEVCIALAGARRPSPGRSRAGAGGQDGRAVKGTVFRREPVLRLLALPFDVVRRPGGRHPGVHVERSVAGEELHDRLGGWAQLRRHVDVAGQGDGRGGVPRG